MRFLFVSFLLNMKRFACNRAFLVTMALLPVMTLAGAWFLRGGEQPVVIRVGVAYPDGDAAARTVADALAVFTDSGVAFTFFAGADTAAAEDAVRTGDLECLYVLAQDFGARVQSGRFDGIVTLIRSPRTIADAIVSEMIFAAVMQTAVSDISAGEVAKVFSADAAAAQAIRHDVGESVALYFDRDAAAFVQAESDYETGVLPGEPPRDWDKRLLHGGAALFLAVAAILTLPRLIEEKKHGVEARLLNRNRALFQLSLFLLLFLCTFGAGLLSVGVAHAVYPVGTLGLGTEAFGLAFFCGAVSMVALCIYTWSDNSDWLYACFVFVPVLIFCFGGVLLDLGEIHALFGAFSYLFLTGAYVDFILTRDLACLGFLAAVFVVSCGIALLGGAWKNKHIRRQ